MFWGHNTYLLIFDPEGYDRKIAAKEVQRLTEIEQLTKEAASIPASDYDKNINIYERLIFLDLDNIKFYDKLAFYKDKKEASERAIERAKEAEKRRTGVHCLSAFSGAHSGVKDSVKRSLRDPDSFEHIKTLIFPLRKDMTHLFTHEIQSKKRLWRLCC